MKRILSSLLFVLIIYVKGFSQITTPVIRANFGVDADLQANYFGGKAQAGNDDWFLLPANLGTGQFVIDTTGAAARNALYAISVPFRRSTFVRTMRYPIYSIVNNRMLLDAAFVRDYHGDDSTVFFNGSKNGDSPGDWATPVSQGIPDKNDILDMMIHIRRAGPNHTDSLWMFGGLSLDNTTGDRYFDFEMYQTDISYDHSTLKFSGYGPDAGHTSWQFDAAGNIIKAGDIIFNAEYQSSSLTLIEARIWVDKNSLTITPASFDWAGQFDGASAGSTFGYASIQPKTNGTYYTGLQGGNNVWGGPFSIILQSDAMVTNYTTGQYVEFSVNLTKLGLDPVTSLAGDPCGMPFRKLLVKTRASASFTAALKDFVAPISMFRVPNVDIATASPSMCNQGSIAEIHVTNPLSTSVYIWSTQNGSIISSPTGPTILVDTPGTYIVSQYLQPGCTVFSRDTVTIVPSNGCFVLPSGIVDFRGAYRDGAAQLNWDVLNNQLVTSFVVQRSYDGVNFTNVGDVDKQQSSSERVPYSFRDDIGNPLAAKVYYRIIVLNADNTVTYSNIISLSLTGNPKDKMIVYPNPAKDIIQLQIQSAINTKTKIDIFDVAGKLVATHPVLIQRGNNTITLDDLAGKPRGVYMIVANNGEEVLQQKVILVK